MISLCHLCTLLCDPFNVEEPRLDRVMAQETRKCFLCSTNIEIVANLSKSSLKDKIHFEPILVWQQADIGGWAPAWQDRSVPTGQKAMRGGGERGLGTNRWLLFTAFFHSPHLHQRSGFEEPIPSWQNV